ncbi:MAG TPA: (d)CMP kinase [Patescibacteria group bacterium]|nr:(d)CMP kinase [Patescibacteria group bacterium]
MNSQLLRKAIAIDGPAASGKTTIGFRLANRIEYMFLDTGCMYRAVTQAVLDQGVNIDDELSVVKLTQQLELDIQPAGLPGKGDGRLYTVLIGGNDVTWELRSHDVDVNVSQISAYSGVRSNLVKRQRAIGVRGQVVMVGRDIGTVVLPDAPLKLYIVASAEERARRRWLEREDRKDNTTYEQNLADIKRRDQFDGHREHSPMRPAADAIVIDTTEKQLDAIIEEILQLDYFEKQYSK